MRRRGGWEQHYVLWEPNLGRNVDVNKRANSLVLVQRTAALRNASTYRTVSAPAILVIAITILVNLLTAKRIEIYKSKLAGITLPVTSGKTTISKFQRRLNDKDRGRWTARLIPDIKPWIGRKSGEANYYVTRMLWIF